VTALDLITGSLQEINAVAQGETPESGDANFALTKLNDLLDEWAARKCYIYDISFPVYTLQPGLSPHTIGPMVQLSSSSLTNNLATFIGANSFNNGDAVTVFNSTNSLNLSGRAQLTTPTQFSVALIAANVPGASDTGNAIISGTTAPTFATPNQGQRPQKVEAASLVLNNSTPNVDIPMNIRDADWWMANRVKPLQTDIPTDLYYDPNFPNGSLYFWPVPNYAYEVRLKLWGTIPQFPNVNYPVSLPPGYGKAIKMSLARDLIGPFQGSWGQQQEDSWKRAMKAIESNNIKSPRGNTADAGMPGIQQGGGFNYFSSLPEGY
jgi:hypothetical protein